MISAHHSANSVSSKDSYSTSDTFDCQVSDNAPQLNELIGLRFRELSDDIEAVLRSQRSSMQSVEGLLAIHKLINKLRINMSHHRKILNTSSTRSALATAASSHSLPNEAKASSALNLSKLSLAKFDKPLPTPSKNLIGFHNPTGSTLSFEHSVAFSES